MTIKSIAAKLFANYAIPKLYKDAGNALKIQERTLLNNIKLAESTAFGKDHHFSQIKNYSDFKRLVPIRDYEGLKNYVEKVVAGQKDILWPGVPLYFSKTSGTTSGAKYIPISKESMQHHITAARNTLLCYIYHTGKADFTNHKMIFLQGGPVLDTSGKIPVGRLSGIVANYVPAYLQKNRMPSWDTNCIKDWEKKVDAIVGETLEENMSLISGIPSWVQMYFEKLVLKTGRRVGEIFPDFKLFVYGGVSYEPYRKRFQELIGHKVDSIELYPASEGFIAFQDEAVNNGLLLNTNAGMFFEFVPADEIFNEKPSRLELSEVKLGVNYAIIINSNAGLWGYNIGDTVKFTHLNPYRIKVTGRTKHYTSAFGEHVIAEEVEAAIQIAVAKTNALVNEFTLAPQVNPAHGLPFHEWIIEFNKEPDDWETFIATLDNSMQALNPYYKDLIKGNVLRRLVVSVVQQGSFISYMKSQGKLGEQNKIPRLQNNRSIADFMVRLSVKTVD